MITFRPIIRADFALLASWLAEPQVARWWNDDPSPAGIETQFGPVVDGTDPTEVFVALADEVPIGLIQRYRLDDEPAFSAELAPICEVPPGALSIDYFIAAESDRGAGLGSRMIAAMVEDCWRRHPDGSAVIVAVIVGNERSWRALERAGLHRVGAGPMTPDNPIDPPDHVVYRADRPRVR